MASVALNNIKKKYGALEVVHGINLDIEHGEFVVLVGPSGCGKSTILRMIAGLESISEGEIMIGEKVATDLPPRLRNISMVFQNYALYPHMTVAENLGFSLKIAKLSNSDIRQRVDYAANILGLSELMDRKPAALSGGQRQRVAMGRAIVRQPDVFLFDEPLSNLDAKLRSQMRVEIKKLHQKVGTSIIYVTHDQVEAMTLADKIVVLRDGRIEQIGSPLELFNNPINTFVATFIGSPPMNLIDALVSVENDKKFLVVNNSIKIPIAKKLSRLVSNNQSIKLGFRADDLSPIGHSAFNDSEIFNINLQVDLAEPLGTETIIYSTLGNAEIQLKMLNPKPLKINDKLNCTLNLSQCRIFDAQSLENIEFKKE